MSKGIFHIFPQQEVTPEDMKIRYLYTRFSEHDSSTEALFAPETETKPKWCSVEISSVDVNLEDFVSEEECDQIISDRIATDTSECFQPHYDAYMNECELRRAGANIAMATRRGRGEYIPEHNLVAYIGRQSDPDAINYDSPIIIAKFGDKYFPYFTPTWSDYIIRVASPPDISVHGDGLEEELTGILVSNMIDALKESENDN